MNVGMRLLPLALAQEDGPPGGDAGTFSDTVWDPERTHADLEVSEGGKLIESYNNHRSAAAAPARDSGKRYFEFEFPYGTSRLDKVYMGLVDIDYVDFQAPLANSASFDGSAWAVLLRTGGGKLHNGSYAAYSHTGGQSSAKVYGLLCDLDAGTMNLHIDGVDQGLVWSGIAGAVLPACSLQYQNNFIRLISNPENLQHLPAAAKSWAQD